MQVLFLVTHGPKNEGFVAVDDFETFTVEEGTSCKIDPPEADPHYNPPTTLSPTNFPDCEFNQSPCGWTMVNSHSMSWMRTKVTILEHAGFDHPKEDHNGKME